MTFKSKRIIASIVTGIAIIIAYIIYSLGDNSPAITNISAWAKVILIFIGIGIGATIVINILFHIFYSIGVSVKERDRCDEEVERIIESNVMEDERDKQISQKSSMIGYSFAGAGFIGALVALAFGCSVIVSLNISLAAFYFGSFAEGIVSIIQYERGV